MGNGTAGDFRCRTAKRFTTWTSVDVRGHWGWSGIVSRSTPRHVLVTATDERRVVGQSDDKCGFAFRLIVGAITRTTTPCKNHIWNAKDVNPWN